MSIGRGNEQLKRLMDTRMTPLANSAVSTVKKSYLFRKSVQRLLIGVGGATILVLFLTTFLHVYEITKFIPWIIAFNAALTGYTVMDKTANLVNRRHIYSVSVGVINVLLTCAVLVILFMFLTGENVFTTWDLVFFIIVGVSFSLLGAWLAIKYSKLKSK